MRVLSLAMSFFDLMTHVVHFCSRLVFLRGSSASFLWDAEHEVSRDLFACVVRIAFVL